MTKFLTMLNSRKRKGSRRRSGKRRHSRRSVRMNPVSRKRGRRRGGRRSSGGSRGMIGGIKNAFRGDTIKIAAGVMLGGIAFDFVNAYFRKAAPTAANANATVSTLPLSDNPIAPYLYGGGIPIVVGMLVSRWSPAIGNGMKIAGVYNVLNTAIGPTVRSEVAALQSKIQGGSAYLGMRGPRAYIPAANGQNLIRGTSNFTGQRPLFAQSAFARR